MMLAHPSKPQLVEFNDEPVHGENGWGLEAYSRDEEKYTGKDGLTSVRTLGRYLYERKNPVTKKHEHRSEIRILEDWSLPFKERKE